MAAQLQPASPAQQPAIQTTHQPTGSAGEQPVEAPQLATIAKLASRAGHPLDWIIKGRAIRPASDAFQTIASGEELLPSIGSPVLLDHPEIRR
jgi:hypothetical protein